MPLLSAWNGFLRLSLVSIPIKASLATARMQGKIRLARIHAQCNRRLEHQEVCPIHGPVDVGGIAFGYEFARGQFIDISTRELNELALGDEKVIRIDSFVSPEAVDPIYFTGWSYYVLPDGPAGLHAYQLLLQGMAELRSVGIAETVLDGRDWIVSLRSRGGVLVMTGIHY